MYDEGRENKVCDDCYAALQHSEAPTTSELTLRRQAPRALQVCLSVCLSVYLSVCISVCLSHSCTLLKLMDSMGCCLAQTREGRFAVGHPVETLTPNSG